jgi:hypothetical protein
MYILLACVICVAAVIIASPFIIALRVVLDSRGVDLAMKRVSK